MRKLFVIALILILSSSANAQNVMLHFNQSPTKDEAENIWTSNGNSIISEINSKGAASLRPALQLNGENYLQAEKGITLGGKNFTIDGWAFVDTNCGNYGRIFEFNVTAKDSKNLIMSRYGSGSDIAFYAEDKRITVPDCIDRLFHFAFVYEDSKELVSIFINGELKGSIKIKIPEREYKIAYIGKSSWDSNGMFVGYLYEFRVTDGKALWTENFNPPQTALKPVEELHPSWKTSESEITSELNPKGCASLTPALQFNGENYLQAENGISLGGRDFTIDGWAFVDTNCGNYGKIFEFNVAAKNSKNLILSRYGSGTDIAAYAEDQRKTIPNLVDRLFHFAFVYEHDNGLVWLYINGELKSKIDVTIPRRHYKISYLGKSSWDSDGMFIGYLHNFRINDGKALWIENFEPPHYDAKSKNEISMSDFGEPSGKWEADGEGYLQKETGIALGGRDFTIEGRAFIDPKCGNYGRIFEFNVAAKNSKNLILCRYGNGAGVAVYAEDVRKVIPDLVDKYFDFKFIYEHRKEIVWLYIDGKLRGKIDARIPRRYYRLSYLGKSSWDSNGMFVGHVENFKIVDGEAIEVSKPEIKTMQPEQKQNKKYEGIKRGF